MKWRASRATELLSLAHQTEDQSDPLGLYRRAALLADAEEDWDTAIEARRAILDEATWLDEEFDQIAAFVWLYKQSRVRSDLFDMGSLLWEYKWVTATLFDLVAIRRELVHRVIDDLEKQHVSRALDAAPAIQLRLSEAIRAQDRSALPGCFDAWTQNESGAGSDCPACRRNVRVDALRSMGRYEQAIEEAGPLLTGKMSCAEIPEETFPLVIESHLRLGDVYRAKQTCTRGVRSLRNLRGISRGLGTYMVCLALTDQVPAGFELLVQWYRRARLSRNDDTRLEFFRGASALCRASEEEQLYLTFPPTFEEFVPDGLYEVATLRSFFDRQVEDLATRFDARNGNDGRWEQLRSDREQLEGRA